MTSPGMQLTAYQLTELSILNTNMHTEILLIDVYFRDESVRRAEEMFHALDNDGNGDLTEVNICWCTFN